MIATIAGASGLIGSALARSLEAAGHRVRRLVRTAAGGPDEFKWDPAGGEIDAAAIEGADAVLNFGGADIAGGRWTAARRRLIRDSRVLGTQLIARTMAGSLHKPSVFINASGAGIYGVHPEGWVDEDSPIGAGFLADVSREWEEATGVAATAGVRVVRLRMGVVIAADGGAVAKMAPIFRLGLGGPIGDGNMWLSWISIVDLVRVIERVIGDARLSGAVNAVAPNPCTNREFASELGTALGKSSAVRTPVFAVRMRFGEMADETILSSSRVRPKKLVDGGFEFVHPTIGEALRALISS